MKVVPLTDFVHNAITAREGHPIDMPESTALDLEKAGLVRISVDKAVAAGKSKDDGPGQPSSASPPALPSKTITTKTLHLPKPGAKKTKKKGR